MTASPIVAMTAPLLDVPIGPVLHTILIGIDK